MADFKRKKGESFEGFLRRFKKGLKDSKRLNVAREKRTIKHKKNKRQQKESALSSLKLSKKREFLRKTGKLVIDPRRHSRG